MCEKNNIHAFSMAGTICGSLWECNVSITLMHCDLLTSRHRCVVLYEMNVLNTL